MGVIRNAISKRVINKAAPEDVKSAARTKKIEILTKEIGLPEYLAHKVADGEITLAQAKNMEVDQAMIRNNSEPPIAPGEFDTFQDKVAQIKARGKKLSGGAVAGSAVMSDDSEAGPLKLAAGLTPDLAARQLKNRLNKEKQRGISPGNTATDFVHRNTNYDNGFLSGVNKSGEGYGGPSYISGVKEFAYELIQSTSDPAVKQAVMEWVQPRMARGMGASAVTASAGAAANDGERQERGPIANILDKMEQIELIPDKATRTVAIELLSDQLMKAINHIEMPARGLWGTARGLFGLATDEKGHDTRRAMQKVYTQPADDSLEQAGQYVLKETGSPAAAATTRTLGMLTDPTFWL